MLGEYNHRAYWTAAYRVAVDYTRPTPTPRPALTRKEYREASEQGRALYDDLRKEFGK